jgi:hypothetical protein
MQEIGQLDLRLQRVGEATTGLLQGLAARAPVLAPAVELSELEPG